MNIGIIIQARMGSTRLPNKVLKPFKNGKSTLSILKKKLSILNIPIILATTTANKDDAINNWANENDFICFRGDEANVLKRFVDCANKYKVDVIVRICADNPFLDVQLLKKLIELYKDEDYFSFIKSDGTPAIKTHYGIFCEIVSQKALVKVLNTELITETDIQHVTPFIYNNPSLFSVEYLPIPEYIEKEYSLRLTIDTQEDFESSDFIINSSKDFFKEETKEILKIVKDNPFLIEKMKSQIKINSK
jgi:spore coat polysaccharide biosynthesis protein SpsF (cytidylyltransferase family)